MQYKAKKMDERGRDTHNLTFLPETDFLIIIHWQSNIVTMLFTKCACVKEEQKEFKKKRKATRNNTRKHEKWLITRVMSHIIVMTFIFFIMYLFPCNRSTVLIYIWFSIWGKSWDTNVFFNLLVDVPLPCCYLP